jgi:hypothetical protein
MLDVWGSDEREADAGASTDLSPAVVEALRYIRGESEPAVVARLTFARWAPLAAAILLAALAGAVVTRHAPTPFPRNPRATNTPTAPERLATFTLIGLMRANDGFSTDELVLPDGGVVAWTSRTSPLQ